MQTSTSILATLLLCGFMGLLGQGIRAALGLKNAAQSVGLDGQPTQQSVFNAAYFLVSLMIGFIAGVLAGITLGLGNLISIDPSNTKVLLGLAAAGYAGADFIENAFSKLMPGVGVPPTPVVSQTITPVLLSATSTAGSVSFFSSASSLSGGDVVGLRAALTITAPTLNADIWTPALSSALTKFKMLSNRRIAAALGQFLVEAGGIFQEVVENLNYTHAEHIVKIFPDEFPTVDSAQPYVGNPEALGNRAYAHKNGNGDEASGDGFRFRGRGLIQLTGRSEYAEFAATIGKTTEEISAYCETPEGAAMSGCWYLSSRGCLPLADTWRLDEITRKVNGNAMEGAAQRVAYSNAALKALGG